MQTQLKWSTTELDTLAPWLRVECHIPRFHHTAALVLPLEKYQLSWGMGRYWKKNTVNIALASEVDPCSSCVYDNEQLLGVSDAVHEFRTHGVIV